MSDHDHRHADDGTQEQSISRGERDVTSCDNTAAAFAQRNGATARPTRSMISHIFYEVNSAYPLTYFRPAVLYCAVLHCIAVLAIAPKHSSKLLSVM